MPYQYLDDIAPADVAFKASGETIEEMFIAAGDATMNVMVEDLETISSDVQRTVNVREETLEMLLFHVLQELIYYKDARQLLLRFKKVQILNQGHDYMFSGEAYGEELNPEKHRLSTDVKAVTLHRFEVTETQKGMEATVILDV